MTNETTDTIEEIARTLEDAAEILDPAPVSVHFENCTFEHNNYGFSYSFSPPPTKEEMEAKEVARILRGRASAIRHMTTTERSAESHG